MKKILIITNLCLCLALIAGFVRHNQNTTDLRHQLEDSMQSAAWGEIANQELAARNEDLMLEINDQAEQLKLNAPAFQTGELAKCQQFALYFEPEENEQFQE